MRGGVLPNEVQLVEVSDGRQIGAFGRIKVSNPYGTFDYKQLSTNSPYIWNDVTAGSGTTTYTYARSSTYLATTTASGDRALRQSVRYVPYVPGKGNVIIMTGKFGTGIANVNQYIGYGDDLDGLFFTYQGASFGILTRTSTSGAAVDTFVAQSSWNIDVMDGTGPSGVTIDPTKMQIYIIDFQWLGVGRVRFSVDIDGVQYIVHEVNNANSATVVYMKTPTLPVRYEVINTGAAVSSTTMEQVCCSVASDGGYSLPGFEYSAGNLITAKRAVTTRTPIFAIRLKSAWPTGQPNRVTARFLDSSGLALTNNCEIEIVHVHGPSGITATWTSADDSSAVEYSTDISAVTPTHAHTIQQAYLVAGVSGKGGSADVTSEYIDEHAYISQNFDSTNSAMLVVYATAETGTSDVCAHITWLEVQ